MTVTLSDFFRDRDFIFTAQIFAGNGLWCFYNIFNTKKLLNRPASVLISNTSGLAGIAYWINENYQLTAAEAVDKRAPLVLALKEWIDAEYAGGRQAALSNHELEQKTEELSGGRLHRL